MKRDVLNIFRSNARFIERESDRARWFIGRVAHANAMKRLAGRAVAGDFGVNLGSACFGVFVLFEDKHPRAFGKNKAIAIGGKWSRGALRLIIPRLCQRAN